MDKRNGVHFMKTYFEMMVDISSVVLSFFISISLDALFYVNVHLHLTEDHKKA